jgi:hypothetical protein
MGFSFPPLRGRGVHWHERVAGLKPWLCVPVFNRFDDRTSDLTS